MATVCRVLGVSASGYYAWQSRPALGAGPGGCGADRADPGDPRPVPRHVRRATRARRAGAQGIHIGRKRVARLMQAAGLAGVSRRAFVTTTRRDPAARPAPDLVQRAFTADGPDRLWVADITYIPTWAGFLLSRRRARCLEPPGGRVGHGRASPHRAGPRRPEHGDRPAPPDRRSSITPIRAVSTRRSPSGSGAGRWGSGPRWGRSATPTTTPCARASSRPSSASSSTGGASPPRPRRAGPSSSTSRAGNPRLALVSGRKCQGGTRRERLSVVTASACPFGVWPMPSSESGEGPE